MDQIEHVLKTVTSRIARVSGIAALALGGSRARGVADEDSDVDVGVYYRGSRPFSISELDAAASEIDDRHASGLVSNFGEWGPGVDGGGWLIIEGLHVDLLYRDLERVEAAIAECRSGKVVTQYQLGHPLGFHNHMWMAEIDVCRPLYEPGGDLKRLKAMIRPYPDSLKQALIRKHLFDSDFELRIAEKPAARADVLCVTGYLLRAAGFLTQVLYALNERYYINEKRALAVTDSFAIQPRGYRATIEGVLAKPGATPPDLASSVAAMRQLHNSIALLCSAPQEKTV